MQLTGVFVFPLCLGNTVLPRWKPARRAVAVSAGGEFEKQPPGFQRRKIQRKLLKLTTRWECEGFFSPFTYPGTVGTLLGFAASQGILLRDELRILKKYMFLFFFPQMLLIGLFSLVR